MAVLEKQREGMFFDVRAVLSRGHAHAQEGGALLARSTAAHVISSRPLSLIMLVPKSDEAPMIDISPASTCGAR